MTPPHRVRAALRALRSTLPALLLAAVLVATGAGTASARIDRTGVYSVAYSDSLYEANARANSVSEIGYDRWVQLGRPRPQRIPTDYVKYPWSATVYAVSYFGPDRNDWVWVQLDYAQWVRAGRPAARDAGWIQGSVYYRYATGDEVYVSALDDSVHRLTGAEWRAAGSPTPDVLDNEGFFTFTWDPTILFVSDIRNGYGRPLGYADWTALGSPTPRTVTRLPGDSVYRYASSSSIWYSGGGLETTITYAQWRAMGFPAPQVRAG